MTTLNRTWARFAICLQGALSLLTFAAIAAEPQASAKQLSDWLVQFDTTVIPPAERAAASRMLNDDLEERLRQANQRSSDAWKAIKNREDWENFRREKLGALRASLGQPVAPTPLRARVTGTLQGRGYRIDNVVFQSRPGLWVTANLYRPAESRLLWPGILISHAHHTPKEHGELQDMGVTWARAGCLVLVVDHLGHGERRQHPFRSTNDYARPFQVSRQDYYFRYDLGIQLQLAGETLAGWIAWDLMRGVDLLLAQPDVDSKRIVLLGAVAGGGDPAAIAAALDERIGVAVPFNFGGPQPETRYPLPENAETWFHYAGGGSWESTRNLSRSAADGFLPWVIVGSIAPRRLVYAHEFSWDRERDPVWKRLQRIYEFYDSSDSLAFTHGRGELRGQPPEATHCTHIGIEHRKLIHSVFQKWLHLEIPGESSDRHSTQMLRAMTPAVERELQPKKLSEILVQMTAERLEHMHAEIALTPPTERRQRLQTNWSRVLGVVEPSSELRARQMEDAQKATIPASLSAEAVLLEGERNIVVPVWLLKPAQAGRAGKAPLVLAMSQAGKQAFVRNRAGEIAALLEQGVAVCLFDVRGTGETSPGSGRGRRSGVTALSSGEQMLGGTLLAGQLRDLRSVLAWLRTKENLDARQIHLWGESFVAPNQPETNFQVPRDDDGALPRSPEALGQLLALFGALYEDDVRSVYAHGGLAGFESVITKHLVLIPHDSTIPGALTTGDLSDVISVLPPCSIRLEGLVDAWNRLLTADELNLLRKTARSSSAELSFEVERTSAARWILDRTAKR